MPKYPHIIVDLRGGMEAPVPAVRRNLCWNGISPVEQREFIQEATAGTHDEMIAVCRNWVTLQMSSN